MTDMNRKQAFASPESQFRHPELVLRDPELSYDDKIAVLRNWKVGLVQRQMTAEDGPERTGVASQVAAITQAIRELRQTQ